MTFLLDSFNFIVNNTMSNNSSVSQRLEWIDATKLLACFLIVYFHLPTSRFVLGGAADGVKNVLDLLFEQPAGALATFFFIAGYFTSQKITFKKLSIKISLFLSSYIIWNTLMALFLSDSMSIGQIYGLGSQDKPCADYPLWFVRDLIVILLFIPLTRFVPWLWALLFIGAALYTNAPYWVLYDAFAMPYFNYWAIFSIGMSMNSVAYNTIAHHMPKVAAISLLGLFPLYIAVKLYCTSLFLFDSLQILRHLLNTVIFISLGYASWRWMPKGMVSVMSSYSSSNFLCYAWHALWIIAIAKVAEQISPSLLHNSLFIIIVPFFIIYISRVSDLILNKYFSIIILLCCNRIPQNMNFIANKQNAKRD